MSNDAEKIIEALGKGELPEIQIGKGNDNKGLIGVRYNKTNARRMKVAIPKRRSAPGMMEVDSQKRRKKNTSKSGVAGIRGLKKHEEGKSAYD